MRQYYLNFIFKKIIVIQAIKSKWEIYVEEDSAATT